MPKNKTVVSSYEGWTDQVLDDYIINEMRSPLDETEREQVARTLRKLMSIADGKEHYATAGHFIQAVLDNNLTEAVFRADSTNVKALPVIAKFIYNHFPACMWNSSSNRQSWSRGKKP